MFAIFIRVFRLRMDESFYSGALTISHLLLTRLNSTVTTARGVITTTWNLTVGPRSQVTVVRVGH